MIVKTEAQSALFSVLHKLKAKKEQAEQDFQSQIAQIDSDIQAVTTALRLLRNGHDTLVVKPPVIVIPNNVFSGKTQREALVEIAKRNSGIVKVSQARKILTDAGVIKDARNTWGMLYTTLTRADEFEKSGRGEFRLVESNSAKLLPSA